MGVKMVDTALFRFGFISDIQYADIEDAMNFSKTEHRGYRDSLENTKKAVAYWNQQHPVPSFVVQLGDIIDGLRRLVHDVKLTAKVCSHKGLSSWKSFWHRTIQVEHGNASGGWELARQFLCSSRSP